MARIDQHTATLRVGDHLTLTPIDMALTLDWEASPYVTLEATCEATDPVLVEMIDPRKGLRGRGELRQRFGTGTALGGLSALWAGLKLAGVSSANTGRSLADLTDDHHQPWNTRTLLPEGCSFNLGLRSREYVERAGETLMRLTFASDEALLADYGLIEADRLYVPGTVREVCRYVLARAGMWLSPGDADAVVEDGAALWQPGQSGWEFVTPIVQRAGLRLYCDEKRVWRLVPHDREPARAHQLRRGQHVIGSTDTLTREGSDELGWYDSVVIRYEWRTEDGTTKQAVDWAGVGSWSRTLQLRYEAVYPGPGAAAHVLARALTRGRALDVEAITDYAIRPGDAALVALGARELAGTIGKVAFEWPGARMSVSLRDARGSTPESYVYAPTGLTYEGVPAGVTYQTYTNLTG